MLSRIKIVVVIGALLSIWSTGAWAQNYKPAFDVTPFVGLRDGGSFSDGLTDDTLRVDAAMCYGVAVDWDVNPSVQMQLLWSRQPTQFDAPSTLIGDLDVDIDYYHFGGTYSWSHDDTFRPYLAVSAGATNFQPTDSGFSDELRFSMGLGVGMKYFLTPHIGLMVEGRGYGTFMNGSGGVFCNHGHCRIEVDSDLFFQAEGRTGVVIRF